jgi:hypothetical protein
VAVLENAVGPQVLQWDESHPESGQAVQQRHEAAGTAVVCALLVPTPRVRLARRCQQPKVNGGIVQQLLWHSLHVALRIGINQSVSAGVRACCICKHAMVEPLFVSIACGTCQGRLPNTNS